MPAERAEPFAGEADGQGAASLILASASPRRRELLAQIGVVPDAILPAEIDETPQRDESVRAYVQRMAALKCAAIADGAAPDAYVLGADTVVSVGRRILGKPRDAGEAARFLLLLSGRRHRVTTAICLRHGGRVAARTVETRVRVKRLSDIELSAWLRQDEWRDKAGGYAIQGMFGAFIPEISGSYSNVVGLPLTETAALLTGMGFHVPWESRS